MLDTRRPDGEPTPMTALKQWIAVTVTTIAIVGATAGCSGGQMQNQPTQEPADAKRSIQQLVDDAHAKDYDLVCLSLTNACVPTGPLLSTLRPPSPELMAAKVARAVQGLRPNRP